MRLVTCARFAVVLSVVACIAAGCGDSIGEPTAEPAIEQAAERAAKSGVAELDLSSPDGIDYDTLLALTPYSNEEQARSEFGAVVEPALPYLPTDDDAGGWVLAFVKDGEVVALRSSNPASFACVNGPIPASGAFFRVYRSSGDGRPQVVPRGLSRRDCV